MFKQSNRKNVAHYQRKLNYQSGSGWQIIVFYLQVKVLGAYAHRWFTAPTWHTLLMVEFQPTSESDRKQP